MAENTIKIDFDLHHITKQIQPLIEEINAHYKNFLDVNKANFDKWNEVVEGYHQRQNETFDEHRNSLHQVQKDLIQKSNAHLSKELQSSIETHKQHVQQLEQLFETQIQNILEEQKNEIEQYCKEQISIFQTTVSSIIKSEFETYHHDVKNLHETAVNSLKDIGTKVYTIEDHQEAFSHKQQHIEETVSDSQKEIKALQELILQQDETIKSLNENMEAILQHISSSQEDSEVQSESKTSIST
jgi:DNA repair exonuclease SbcCD ATPase subunit